MQPKTDNGITRLIHEVAHKSWFNFADADQNSWLEPYFRQPDQELLPSQRQLRMDVLTQITHDPDLFDMSEWKYEYDCGTARCVQGWAQYLGGFPKLVNMAPEATVSADNELSSEQREIIGILLLGLTAEEYYTDVDEKAGALFFTDDDDALERLTELARARARRALADDAAIRDNVALETCTCRCGMTATVMPGVFPHPECHTSPSVAPELAAAMAETRDIVALLDEATRMGLDCQWLNWRHKARLKKIREKTGLPVTAPMRAADGSGYGTSEQGGTP